MKKLIMIMVNLMAAASTAYASNVVDLKNAEVGQIMSLKKDVIFNEGIGAIKISSSTIHLPNIKGDVVAVGVSCAISRDEEGDNCAGFKKTKVNAGKTMMIGEVPHRTQDYYNYSADVWYSVLIGKGVVGKITKNKCTYTLKLYCSVDYSMQDFKREVVQIAEKELLSQAAQHVKIQEDPSEPTPWP